MGFFLVFFSFNSFFFKAFSLPNSLTNVFDIPRSSRQKRSEEVTTVSVCGRATHSYLSRRRSSHPQVDVGAVLLPPPPPPSSKQYPQSQAAAAAKRSKDKNTLWLPRHARDFFVRSSIVLFCAFRQSPPPHPSFGMEQMILKWFLIPPPKLFFCFKLFSRFMHLSLSFLFILTTIIQGNTTKLRLQKIPSPRVVLLQVNDNINLLRRTFNLGLTFPDFRGERIK